MSVFKIAGLTACLALMAGCANMNTVGRATTTPPTQYDALRANGLAIHTDAQQRLTIFNRGGFCAEPFPDAMSAYASSMGLSANVPSQAQASFANSLSSSAASIGLRTQSITLMRDALYRMCEAYNNGKLSDVMVATLIQSSQNLTAAVLAVEQLTGPVVARQAVLGGSATTDAATILSANQDILNDAEERVTRATNERDEAATTLAASRTALTEAERTLAAAQAPVDLTAQPAAGTTQTGQGDATPDVAELQTTVDAAEARVTMNQAELDLRNRLLKQATEVRDAVKDTRDAARVSVTAAVATSGQFGDPTSGGLTTRDPAMVADAVKEIVLNAMDRDYTQVACLAFLTAEAKQGSTQDQGARDACVELVKATVNLQAALTEKREQEVKDSMLKSAPDEASNIIQRGLSSGAITQAEINAYLRNFPGTLTWSQVASNTRYKAVTEAVLQYFRARGKL